MRTLQRSWKGKIVDGKVVAVPANEELAENMWLQFKTGKINARGEANV